MKHARTATRMASARLRCMDFAYCLIHGTRNRTWGMRIRMGWLSSRDQASLTILILERFESDWNRVL
jgi:hypothetical protein